LFGLGQSLLLALPPERAHDLAIKSLELGLYPRASQPDDKRLAQHLFGLDFPNPIGMAAGFDKNARVAGELLGMGFGFVEVGTLTPRAQSSNASPRLFRSIVDRAIINRLGFNNEGQDAALQRLKPRVGGVVGVNLGAGRTSPDRIGDYVSGIARMAEVASYFTINISSPNTPGLRDLQAPEALDALLKRVQDARAALPRKPALLVKLAPDIADEELPEVVRVIVSHGVDGIVVSNTTLSREGLRDQGFAKEDGARSALFAILRGQRRLFTEEAAATARGRFIAEAPPRSRPAPLSSSSIPGSCSKGLR
jgi:dihydroorotate dehydrogenase